MENKVAFTKKQTALIICMFFIMMALIVNGVVYVRDHSDHRGEAKPEQQDVPVHADIVARESGEKQYVVRLYHGNIAVFGSENPDSPLYVTDITQDTLRTYDKEQLETGITVYGDTALSMILEDFGS